MTKFDWPCDLRIAHGAHIVREYEKGALPRECIGVQAHPDTMIGKAKHPMAVAR